MNTLRPSDRPGIARAPALTAEQHSNLQAKLRWQALAAPLNLKTRELARKLDYHESTLRGWLHRGALNRKPPEPAFEKLERLAQLHALYREFGAVG